jgi:hypothetical protein
MNPVKTMLISVAIPGASYSAGVFSIPWTALNTILTNDGSAVDSFERLIEALVTTIIEKTTSGAFTQPLLGVEVSSTSLGTGVWETPANTFSQHTLLSTVLTFDMGTSTGYLQSPDGVINH